MYHSALTLSRDDEEIGIYRNRTIGFLPFLATGFLLLTYGSAGRYSWSSGVSTLPRAWHRHLTRVPVETTRHFLQGSLLLSESGKPLGRASRPSYSGIPKKSTATWRPKYHSGSSDYSRWDKQQEIGTDRRNIRDSEANGVWKQRGCVSSGWIHLQMWWRRNASEHVIRIERIRERGSMWIICKNTTRNDPPKRRDSWEGPSLEGML